MITLLGVANADSPPHSGDFWGILISALFVSSIIAMAVIVSVMKYQSLGLGADSNPVERHIIPDGMTDEEFHSTKNAVYGALDDGGLTTDELLLRVHLPLSITSLDSSDRLATLTHIGFDGIFRFGQDDHGLWWRVSDNTEVAHHWALHQDDANA